MAGILRGDIDWSALDPTVGHEQAGTRPFLVVSNDVFNRHSGTVIGFPLTSQPPRVGFPLVLEMVESGLPKKSWVKIGQIRTVSIKRLGRKIGKASDVDLDIIVDGLNEIIDS